MNVHLSIPTNLLASTTNSISFCATPAARTMKAVVLTESASTLRIGTSPPLNVAPVGIYSCAYKRLNIYEYMYVYVCMYLYV
jgi:hypothetical protein